MTGTKREKKYQWIFLIQQRIPGLLLDIRPCPGGWEYLLHQHSAPLNQCGLFRKRSKADYICNTLCCIGEENSDNPNENIVHLVSFGQGRHWL